MDVKSVQANCEANTGIAGIGVVVSYVISSLASIFITLFCVSKDNVKDFEGTISGLGSTQLLTSWAITIASTAAYPRSLQDPHAMLAALLSLLASISQAVPLWSGVLWDKPQMLKFRQTLNCVHIIVFLGSFFGRRGGVANATPAFIRWSVVIITIFAFFWNLGLTISVLCTGRKKRAMQEKDKDGAFVIGCIASIPTLYLVALVFYMKFGLKVCPLNTSEDNAWSFGQTLSILMAVAPFLAAAEDFINLKASGRKSSPEGHELTAWPGHAPNHVNNKSNKKT